MLDHELSIDFLVDKSSQPSNCIAQFSARIRAVPRAVNALPEEFQWKQKTKCLYILEIKI